MVNAYWQPCAKTVIRYSHKHKIPCPFKWQGIFFITRKGESFMISANGLQVRYNPMRITSFDVFCSMRGAYRPPVKDVYFICWAGCPDKPEPFCQRLGTLVASAKDTGILCENRLDTYLCPEDAAKAQTWLFSAGKPQALPFDFADSLLAETFSIAFSEMISLYQQYRQHTTASMLRNFQIKLLYWAYRYLPALFPDRKSVV